MASEQKKGDAKGKSGNAKETTCCPRVNRTLLVPKFYYFFFFSAWGSLLPYLALYFKQLLLSPSEVGILMGLKPFVNFLVIPIWGAIVDKCQKSKVVLIISMVALIISTFALCLVDGPQEKRTIVQRYCNMTTVTHSDFINIHRPVIDNPDIELTGTEIDKMEDTDRDLFLSYFYKGQSPWSLSLVNLDESADSFVRTTIDSTQCFITLFLITFFGTLISAPTLALVDTATLQLLGTETHKYGMQRLTGSVGWGVGAFVVGASLKTTHTCGKDKDYEIVDYIPCFYTFAALMSLGLITATRFTFREKTKSSHGGGSLRVGLRALKSTRYLMFLFTALYLGFQMAFIKTFLFWHLKDLGGSQLLFSIISAVNCFAEVSMYFLSAKLIKKIGHARVLYMGLVCYAVRLFYYSVIREPWLVLVVELLPGITTAAVWAACLSYVSINSGPGAATTMQCILHGVHWGLGYGAGEVIGGVMVHHYGAPTTFVIFGVLCLVILGMYILINYLCKAPEEKDSCLNDADSEQSASGESHVEPATEQKEDEKSEKIQ